MLLSPDGMRDMAKRTHYACWTLALLSLGSSPALVQFSCDSDAGETGYIRVTPNHAYTQPDSTGAVELPNLPRGSYRLRMWRLSSSVVTRDIEMPSRGDVSVDLRL